MSKANHITERDRQRIAQALGFDRNTGGLLLEHRAVVYSRKDKIENPRNQRKSRSWMRDWN